MKNVVLSIATLMMVFFAAQGYAQCDPDKHANDCIPKLGDGFNFLKAYKVDGQNGAKDKVEYSYVFTAGTQYKINVCAPDGSNDGIVVKLYDSKRNVVGTSVYNGQQLSGFTYPCTTTGIYYINYSFDGSQSYCGGSALGFKR